MDTVVSLSDFLAVSASGFTTGVVIGLCAVAVRVSRRAVASMATGSIRSI